MKVGGHTKASDLSRIQWELIENADGRRTRKESHIYLKITVLRW